MSTWSRSIHMTVEKHTLSFFFFMKSWQDLFNDSEQIDPTNSTNTIESQQICECDLSQNDPNLSINNTISQWIAINHTKRLVYY